MTCLSTLTSELKSVIENKKITQGHPGLAATSLFLSNKHKYLGKELPHKETKVDVSNTNIMDSVKSNNNNYQQNYQKKHKIDTDSMKWIKHSYHYRYYVVLIVL